MERLILDISDKRIHLDKGKLTMASPCEQKHQAALVAELQKPNPRFYFLNENDQRSSVTPPILIVRYLFSSDGKELHQLYQWWVNELFTSDSTLKRIDNKNIDWNHLSIEQKICIFAEPLIASQPLSLIFLEDLHLTEKAQQIIIDKIKNYSREYNNNPIIFWEYRTQIANAHPLYFSGF